MSLSKKKDEEVIKRMVTDNKENEIKVGFGVFMVDRVEFGEKTVARLGFEAYVTVLKTNDARVVFLAMTNNIELTFPTINNNWISGEIRRFFLIG